MSLHVSGIKVLVKLYKKISKVVAHFKHSLLFTNTPRAFSYPLLKFVQIRVIFYQGF